MERFKLTMTETSDIEVSFSGKFREGKPSLVDLTIRGAMFTINMETLETLRERIIEQDETTVNFMDGELEISFTVGRHDVEMFIHDGKVERHFTVYRLELLDCLDKFFRDYYKT